MSSTEDRLLFVFKTPNDFFTEDLRIKFLSEEGQKTGEQGDGFRTCYEMSETRTF